MRTEAEYAALIPTEPPADFIDFLRGEVNVFRHEYLTFKCISRAKAEACDACADWRALLWCSACEHEMLAEYKPGNLAFNDRPAVVLPMIDDDVDEVVADSGSVALCPYCGARVTLKSAQELGRYGMREEGSAVVPTVADGCLVLTTWLAERRITCGRQRMTTNVLNAYIFDGKRVVKMDRWRRYGLSGAWYPLDKWTKASRAADGMIAPYFYEAEDGLPDLGGTPAENAKLWEYKAACYDGGDFCPVAYMKVYRKHPNIENLITAGFAPWVGKEIARARGSGIAPRFDGVDWTKARPAQMLGLTKEQARVFKEKHYELYYLQIWQARKGQVDFNTMILLLDALGGETENLLASGEPPVRTVNYLKKQHSSYSYLCDYRRMAARAGFDLTQEPVKWPKDLRAAHDRALAAIKFEEEEAEAATFREMSARCKGLAWEHDGICIRPAMTPSELVQEGDTLHHCVGGYAKTHAAGNIILFIRHTRRPERSWYTLNIDVKTHRQIQLHGYGNEYANGKRLHIDKRVLTFVELWRREVLDKWTLPAVPNVTTTKKKSPADKPAA